MNIYKTILEKKDQLTENVYKFRFSAVSPQEIVFNAGQYVMLSVPHINNPIKRLYSIASSMNEKKCFDLIIRLVDGGIASNYLSHLVVGQEVLFEGPAGVFSLQQTQNKKVFMATGTGIAPIRSFLFSYPTITTQTYLFWGFSYIKDVFLLDEIRLFAQNNPLFHFYICVSRENDFSFLDEAVRPYFHHGRITTVCLSFFPSFSQTNTEFYICGRREMVESTREYLYNQQVDRSLVHFERY